MLFRYEFRIKEIIIIKLRLGDITDLLPQVHLGAFGINEGSTDPFWIG